MNKKEKVEIKKYSFKEKGDDLRFLDLLRKCNVNFTLLETEANLKDKKINIIVEYKKDIFK